MRTHLSIYVKNVKESVEFYEMVFDIKPQKQNDNYAKFDIKDPSLNFSMQSHGDHPISQVNHLGVEVNSPKELTEWQERLESYGLVKKVESQTDCCFARQDKFWFEDPNGNSWEVFYVFEQLPIHPFALKGSQCCM